MKRPKPINSLLTIDNHRHSNTDLMTNTSKSIENYRKEYAECSSNLNMSKSVFSFTNLQKLQNRIILASNKNFNLQNRQIQLNRTSHQTKTGCKKHLKFYSSNFTSKLLPIPIIFVIFILSFISVEVSALIRCLDCVGKDCMGSFCEGDYCVLSHYAPRWGTMEWGKPRVVKGCMTGSMLRDDVRSHCETADEDGQVFF